MQITSHISISLALLGLSILCAGLWVRADDHNGAESLDTQERKLPKIFDFDYYKKAFDKSYGSALEELSRKRLFFSRAVSAFVSGVKYKFRASSYFLGINHLSDTTPEERAQMSNNIPETVIGDKEDEQDEQDEQASELPEFIPAEGEDVTKELVELVKDHANEPAYEDLRNAFGGGRVKRSTTNGQDDVVPALPPRDFSLDMLMADKPIVTSLPVPPIGKFVESNNQNYEPFDMPSYGFGGKTKKIEWVELKKEDPRSVGQQLRDCLTSTWAKLTGQGKASDVSKALEAKEALPDEVFLDLRTTNCIAPVRSQKSCGSCYAFAAIAMMEYHYCKMTGQLVTFSEQYMVDCGKGRKGFSLLGCKGGNLHGVAWFLENYGLETRQHYPYVGQLAQCPYPKHYDLMKTGYIRMNLKAATSVPIDMWAGVLENGPLYVRFAVGFNFLDYRKGVYTCDEKRFSSYHAMVVVGHGRQDGQEYWLLRNSHSERWGEGGYMKLSKQFAKKCIKPRLGNALGTRDAKNYTVEAETVRDNATVDWTHAEKVKQSAAKKKKWGWRG